MIEKLIILIEKVKEKITDEADMLPSGYETAGALRTELEAAVSNLKAGKTDCLDDLNMHFLPTSTFQEHSQLTGWSDEFIEMAAEFDDIYTTLKNKN